ncbi:androgen-dependent TFPI-regulating protein-like isoform X3 [Palaemon carinicauda]|uniref:androgen-dependent TFPI-regulating protein-like isoform X3 n=1 Tax=Palaemon carinicauda TaxID=392227 RepID=UPI0035B5E94B
MSVFSSLIHILVFIIWSVGVYVDAWLLNPPLDGPHYDFDFNQYGGRLKYLTVLNSLLQCGFFGLCVANDLFGSEAKVRNEQSALQKYRDWLFTTLVFPMGLFVSLIFWSLYAIDRELIFPAELDLWFPAWLNHVMHTLPAIGVLIEVFMVCHVYETGVKRFKPIVAAYFMYLTWICYIAYFGGIWVYPVFEVFDMTGRTIFFAALLFPNLFFVLLGQKIHTTVWGTVTDGKKERKAE